MNLLRHFPDQEQTASNQDQVSPRETMFKSRADRLRDLDHDRNGSKQAQAENRVTADAYTRCRYLLMGRELVGQGRNDDEAVDPEHDLHDEGRQGGSSCRICGQGN
jgi:hypothetical protein